MEIYKNKFLVKKFSKKINNKYKKYLLFSNIIIYISLNKKMPSVKVGAKSASNAIIGTITKLRSGLKDLQTKHARMNMSIAVFTEARAKLHAKLGGAAAAQELISTESVDSFNPEMFKVEKNTIQAQIHDITPNDVKNAFKEDITLKNFANIAWYENPGANINKNFMTKDTKFKFQEDNAPAVPQLAGANARALNLLSALMKSNRVKDDGGENLVEPFDVEERKIKPEHVGISATDINVLNNAFRSNSYRADLANATDATVTDRTKYNFDFARDITDGVAKDNHYYLNTIVNNTVPAGAVNHYANKMLRPAIKDNESLFNFASEINTLIKANANFDEDFKNKLMDILIVLRNIINGTVETGGGNPSVTSNVVYNVCALIGAIIGAAHTDGTIQILNVGGAGAAGAAIMIGGGGNQATSAAGAEGFTNALTSIEAVLKEDTLNIKKAGAEFLRIIGVHKDSMEAGAGDLDNLKKFVKLAITYVIKATIAASTPATSNTEANNVINAIYTVVNAIPATLGNDTNNGELSKIPVTDLVAAGVVVDNGAWTTAKNLFNTSANTAKDAGVATEYGATVQDISTYATTLITALRIKLDSRMTFLKDVIRKIKLPLYTIDLAADGSGDGKITSIGSGAGSGTDGVDDNLKNYVTYLFNKMASKDPTAFAALPTDVKNASPFDHTAFTNTIITTPGSGGGGGRTEDQYNALQEFLKTYAYYPSILFSSYNPTTNVIGNIATPADDIHPSIYNSSLFIQIVTSPSATTEAYMKLTSEISKLDQDKVRLTDQITKIEARLAAAVQEKEAAEQQRDAALQAEKTAKNETAVYEGFTNKLSNDFEALYRNANIKEYMTNWSNSGTIAGNFQRITYTGGRKYVGGHVSNQEFNAFLNSIKNPTIRTNGSVETKLANLQEKLLPYYKSIATMSLSNTQRASFNNKMKTIMAPISEELANELKNKNEVSIQQKVTEITKEVNKLAKSKKIEELRALLDPSATVNGVNKKNPRAYQAALNIVLNQINLENANLGNLKASVNSIKEELKGKLKVKNEEYNMYNTSLLYKNTSPAVQQAVTAAAEAASTAETAVNLVEGETNVNPEVVENVNAARRAAAKAVQQATTNPESAVVNASNAIAKAKEALRSLIANLQNENSISNRNDIKTVLKQIKANIANEEMKTVKNVRKILGNNISGNGNEQNQGNLSSMFTGRETNENSTKINHGKGLRNALNSYTNGSNTSAIKAAYNEFMAKTNVNKSSVNNKNDLISRANAILNLKTNASEAVNATNGSSAPVNAPNNTKTTLESLLSVNLSSMNNNAKYEHLKALAAADMAYSKKSNAISSLLTQSATTIATIISTLTGEIKIRTSKNTNNVVKTFTLNPGNAKEINIRPEIYVIYKKMKNNENAKLASNSGSQVGSNVNVKSRLREVTNEIKTFLSTTFKNSKSLQNIINNPTASLNTRNNLNTYKSKVSELLTKLIELIKLNYAHSLTNNNNDNGSTELIKSILSKNLYTYSINGVKITKNGVTKNLTQITFVKEDRSEEAPINIRPSCIPSNNNSTSSSAPSEPVNNSINSKVTKLLANINNQKTLQEKLDIIRTFINDNNFKTLNQINRNKIVDKYILLLKEYVNSNNYNGVYLINLKKPIKNLNEGQNKSELLTKIESITKEIKNKIKRKVRI